MLIKKQVTVKVKLATGQVIAVHVLCKQSPGEEYGLGKVYVQYDRLTLASVAAVDGAFTGNYNTMISSGISIAANRNFTSKSGANGAGTTLDPTTIRSIVYGAVYRNAVQRSVGQMHPADQCCGGPGELHRRYHLRKSEWRALLALPGDGRIGSGNAGSLQKTR